MQLDLHFQASEPEKPKIFTVSEITRQVRLLLEREIGQVWVEGEVSNLRRQASGHQYFTLKDATSQIPCVLFAGQSAAMRGVRLEDGLQVQVCGELTVYEARGQYQMIVRLVQLKGAGALQAKFEALKQKLAAEGLFDPERKRPLPPFPKRIGLVTSPTGAAIRDFLNILHRRHPGMQVVLNPVKVQGRGAAVEIARAVREFGEAEKLGIGPVDVIVVTRGGGSIEDLWEFNEEVVARAIAESPLPVVSAVGHEIDFTISDFAADFRAPTPSAAAEILAADSVAVIAKLREDVGRMARAAGNRMQFLSSRLDGIRHSGVFREPRRLLEETRQTLDRYFEDMEHAAALSVERARGQLRHSFSTLEARSPLNAIRHSGVQVGHLFQRIQQLGQSGAEKPRARLEKAAAMLAALNPDAELARGFTMTLDKDGKFLSSAKKIKKGEVLRTRFRDGEVQSVVSDR